MFRIRDLSFIGKIGGIPFASFFIDESFFCVCKPDTVAVFIPVFWHGRIFFPEFLVKNVLGGHVFCIKIADVFGFTGFQFINFLKDVLSGVLCASSELSFTEDFMELCHLMLRGTSFPVRPDICACMISTVPGIHVEILGFMGNFMEFDQGKDSWIDTGRCAALSCMVLAESRTHSSSYETTLEIIYLRTHATNQAYDETFENV